MLSAGFSALQAVMGDSFTLDAVTYTGTFSEERKESDFVEYSQREIVTRPCVAMTEQFEAAPDPNLRPELVYGGATYVVQSVHEDQVHYTFLLQKRT